MFGRPLFLLWLPLAVGAAAALFWRGAKLRQAATLRLGQAATLARLIPAEAASRRRLRSRLRLAGLALLFLALAGPRWGVELVETRSSARRVILAVDVSASMTAEDIKPNRLEKAKGELAQLLDGLRGERVGILAFAGVPGTMCPLTSDVDAAKQVLRALEVGAVPEPGTAIGSAVREAVAQLERSPGGRAVVLLTDGEDHRTDPLGAAEEAAKAGVRVFAIGIGTPEGEPLPVKEAGALTGYKKDASGGTVISRLGEKTLADIAAKTGGAYFRASPGEEEVPAILRALGGLEKAEGSVGLANRYKDRYQYPLILALLLLLIELLIPDTETRRPAAPSKTSRGRAAAASAAALLLLLPSMARAAGKEGLLRSGNRLYEKGDYQGALERYREGEKRGDERARFNAGNAHYKLEDLPAAQERFESLTSTASSRAVRAAAYYNLGDALMGQGQAADAVAAFRKAVTLDPTDAEARHNLAVALKNQKQPPQKGKDDKQKKKDDQKKDQSPPQQPKTRPQDQLSREDAERLLRSVKEKEKTAAAPQQKSKGTKGGGPEDW